MKAGSNLERILTEGKFAATAELGPPKSADAEAIRKKAAILKGKVDAVNITDNQTAIVRMSSIGAAKLTLDTGLEPIMQMVCRDRNRIAMQSDILGAAALGLKNMLCLTGDHQKAGNHPTAKNVFDIDSLQLLQIVKNMRDNKVFQNGEEIRNTKKAPIVEPKMFLGAAENPFAHPYEFRAIRLAKKMKAGADFIQTQCIFDIPRFKEWMKEVVDRGTHEKLFILAGVMPIKSPRVIEYMKNNVPGMSIPDELVKRMKGASDPKEEGVNFVVELINEVRQIEGIRGVHIMAVEWEEIVPSIVERAGLLPRP
ncbi:MAG: methylenetetrahydrofolate reductase [Candidatus Abyssobacteria bacterium SURF_5]|uniref:Methylenetetrahydrofolate reductase n=1 Tax=Abyssobacteria bacterium (strain SURF_5) TaxID=2093360 RepID=A0A3A4NSP4_ABYX5|nr:MAG: methylenetetrahydrofolate reductase [Candidatus Abyssubacteria bacterium SURF_5]